MHKNLKMTAAILLAQLVFIAPGVAEAAKRKGVVSTEELSAKGQKILWQDPLDIQSRDLLYGQGGKGQQPPGKVFEFVKEDLNGTNPKFVIKDPNGTKWKLKLGDEAKPETVAARLVWAAGYTTDEDFFLPEVRVDKMPDHVRRGKELIGSGGTMHNVRLKREIAGEKKLGEWKWADDPFTKTREWNGLRVMMALVNNWDLKDQNNSVYEVGKKDDRRLFYVVSDLGASFGPDHLDLRRKTSKGELATFRKTAFIRTTHPETVDFRVPGAPPLIMIFTPREYFSRLRLRWIGRAIPRQDAHWIGTILSRLSGQQIRDAFRAGGYSPDQVEAFSSILEHRIAALNEL